MTQCRRCMHGGQELLLLLLPRRRLLCCCCCCCSTAVGRTTTTTITTTLLHRQPLATATAPSRRRRCWPGGRSTPSTTTATGTDTSSCRGRRGGQLGQWYGWPQRGRRQLVEEGEGGAAVARHIEEAKGGQAAARARGRAVIHAPASTPAGGTGQLQRTSGSGSKYWQHTRICELKMMVLHTTVMPGSGSRGCSEAALMTEST